MRPVALWVLLMSRIVAQASPLWLVLFATGCMSSNHDILAASDSGSSVLPDAGDDAPGADTGEDASDPDATEGLIEDAPSEIPPPIQPDGPSVFSFVNGVADSAAIRVCFAVRNGTTFELLHEAPWPADAGGLAYGRALSAASVPGGADLATTDIRPIVLAGDLVAMGSTKCDAADPPPPGVVLAPLEVIPAGTLSHGRHVIIVAAGCVGGPSHSDIAQNTVCGSEYAVNHATATLFVASVDRTPTPGYVGLQVLAASVATPEAQVNHVTADPVVRTTIATNVAPGEVAPQPPNTELQAGALGGLASSNMFELIETNAASASATVLVGDAMARGGVAAQDIADGKNFTVLLLGPRAGMGAGSWWNEFTMTLVRNDPQ